VTDPAKETPLLTNRLSLPSINAMRAGSNPGRRRCFQMAENMEGSPVYSRMWGPDELSPSGSLAS
jgi:hypothetical protein